jgi:LacI family transcriptional regulator, galactose operon repressor
MTHALDRPRASCYLGAVRTLKDVARASGFGVGTVSRALSGSPHVDPQTRIHIEAVAREIGYTSNSLARALRRSKSHVVGLVIPDLTTQFYGLASAALQTELANAGYQLLLCCSNDDPATERSLLVSLIERRVDGIALVPSSAEGASAIRAAHPALPIVEFGRRSGDPGADSVSGDEAFGARSLIQHLIDKGHESIGMIAGPSELSTTKARVAGFRAAISKNGLARRSCPIIHEPYDWEFSKKATGELIQRQVTAIFASATMFTAGAYESLRSAKLRIPHDISVVGFLDPEWYSVATPTVTTYKLPLEQIGTGAASLLLERMRVLTSSSRDAKPTHLRFSGQLILRGSVGIASSPTYGGRKAPEIAP